jgi:N-acetylglucosaminyldiphosphoundecaprenol N-acetyl-beta-D-mannosaminyltransferase
VSSFDFTQTQRLAILGVEIDCVDFALTLDLIDAWVMQRRAASDAPPACRQICTVNPEFIVDARRDPAFARVLADADLCVPDGAGVLWAARRMGQPLHERVTGSDGIYRICARAAARGWRVYLLGAAPGVAEQAAAVLLDRYPGLIVAGCYAGSPADAEWPDICARLNAAAPDILFVAYGHPRQDFWIDQHRAELPAAVAIGVGGGVRFCGGRGAARASVDAAAQSGVAAPVDHAAVALAADAEIAGVRRLSAVRTTSPARRQRIHRTAPVVRRAGDVY